MRLGLHALAVAGVRDVGLQRRGLPSLRTHELGRVLGRCEVEIDEGDVGAVPGARDRSRTTVAGRSIRFGRRTGPATDDQDTYAVEAHEAASSGRPGGPGSGCTRPRRGTPGPSR